MPRERADSAATSATRRAWRKLQLQQRRQLQHAVVMADASERALWAPTLETAVSLLLVPRALSALVNPIADCDEVFNYWEPLHYLLYGFGFQTWEYSPVYALRSYVYVLAHALVARGASLALRLGLSVGGENVSKILVFYTLRGALALLSACCEAQLYRACLARWGRRTARYVLWFLLFSAGLFHASTALLPSTTVMYLVMLFLSCWMERRHYAAIACGIVAVLCGWPYVGVLFVPFFVDTLRARGVVRSLLAGIAVGAGVLLLELAVNYVFYQRVVVPAWNIVLYNVLSNDTDSTLYGTEPWSFYARNLVLNFNVVAVLAIPTLACVFLLPASPASSIASRIAFLSPLYVWLAIMTAQAHKEERFLFPVYPLLCLAAAVTLSALVHVGNRMQAKLRRHRALVFLVRAAVALLVYGTMTTYAALSISRVASNVINYLAPMRVYQHLHDHVLPSSTSLATSSTTPTRLCVGKEWYRFPSSFFIPTNATSVSFLRSEFRGQLPKPFEQHDMGTSVIPSHMNHLNQEEPTRYTELADCDYVVDLNLPTQQEIKLWEHPEEWQWIYGDAFLNADASESPFRSFYVPMLTPRRVKFATYAVYKRIKQ